MSVYGNCVIDIVRGIQRQRGHLGRVPAACERVSDKIHRQKE